jgi:hypothetical protein
VDARSRPQNHKDFFGGNSAEVPGAHRNGVRGVTLT